MNYPHFTFRMLLAAAMLWNAIAQAAVSQAGGSSGSGGGFGTSLANGYINVKTSYGALGNNVHDDTTNIQNAVNYAITNFPGGATLYFPPGTYLLSGALKDTSHANAQIVIPPATNLNKLTTTLRFEGNVMPAQSMSILAPGETNNGGAILKSTITGSGAVIGTYFGSGPAPGFNAVQAEFANLTVVVKPTSGMSGINLRNAFGTRMTGVQVFNGLAPFETPQPTTATATGIMTPTNNNAAFTTLQDCSVSGFYNGYEMNEHTTGDNLSAWACINAYVFPFSFHALDFGRLMSVHCQNGLVWTGTSRVNVCEYDVEHAATADWKTTVWDATDGGNNNGYANIRWGAVLQNSGVDHTFNVQGVNICSAEIGTGTCTAGGGSFAASLPPVQTGYPLLVSWDADGITNASTGSAVSYVPDLGTNGWHLTQTSAGLRPTVTFNEQNGHKAMTFADASYLTNLPYVRAQPHEVFVVAKLTPAGHTFYNLVFDGGSSSHQHELYELSLAGNSGIYAGSTLDIVPNLPENKWVVFDAVYNGASSVLYTNGVQFVAGNAGSDDIQSFWLMALQSYVANNSGHTTVGKVLRVDTYQTNFPAGAFSAPRSNIFCWYTNRYNIAP